MILSSRMLYMFTVFAALVTLALTSDITQSVSGWSSVLP
jgi:hypothetical protein